MKPVDRASSSKGSRTFVPTVAAAAASLLATMGAQVPQMWKGAVERASLSHRHESAWAAAGVDPLILKPAAPTIRLAQHRSHASHASHHSSSPPPGHASHASHTSHYSGSGPGLPRSPAPVSPAPNPALPTPLAPDAAPAAPVTLDIVSTLAKQADGSRFLSMLKAAGLSTTLHGKGPFTIFVPTDDAFDSFKGDLPRDASSPEGADALKRAVTFHIVKGEFPTQRARSTAALVTLNGQRLPLRAEGDSFRVGRAKVIRSDIRCANGVIHFVDAVDLPAAVDLIETLRADGRFKLFVAGLTTAELAPVFRTSGPFTIFAPTDEAIGRMPASEWNRLLQPAARAELAALLKAHIMSGRVYTDQAAQAGVVTMSSGDVFPVAAAGDRCTVGNANITNADLDAGNGVVHVIDRVLTPAVEKPGAPPAGR